MDFEDLKGCLSSALSRREDIKIGWHLFPASESRQSYLEQYIAMTHHISAIENAMQKQKPTYIRTDEKP